MRALPVAVAARPLARQRHALLHVVVENRSSAINESGDHYAAFTATRLSLAPVAQPTCADGTSWKRH